VDFGVSGAMPPGLAGLSLVQAMSPFADLLRRRGVTWFGAESLGIEVSAEELNRDERLGHEAGRHRRESLDARSVSGRRARRTVEDRDRFSRELLGRSEPVERVLERKKKIFAAENQPLTRRRLDAHSAKRSTANDSSNVAKVETVDGVLTALDQTMTTDDGAEWRLEITTIKNGVELNDIEFNPAGLGS
jgi:hypothetical protein